MIVFLLLLSIATIGSFYQGLPAYNHFPVHTFFGMAFRYNADKIGDATVVCLAYYCHFDESGGCLAACERFAANVPIIPKPGVPHREQPVKDEEQCRNDCKDSQNKGSVSNCHFLCERHFSFANRLEYESEFWEFVKIQRDHSKKYLG